MRVLVSDNVPEAGVLVLREAGVEVDVNVGLAPDELLAVIGNYDGLVVRSATKVTADVIAAAPNLKVVGRAGVGVDNIDLDAATKAGVVVMNTPGGSAIAVAEHAMALLLGLLRRIPRAVTSMKDGRWEKKTLKGRQLYGKTLGVIGVGNIGSVLVKRALAFGMSAVAYDPFISEEAAAKLGAELVSLDALFERADVISLHVPLTDRTHHIINREALAKMKPGTVLVNCARGGVVHEGDLAEALREGQIAGAALDVFEQEPPNPENPLLALDNFICSPHLGASTLEAQEAVACMLANQIVAFFDHGTIQNSVNVTAVSRELLDTLGPWLELGKRVGAVAAHLAPPQATQVEALFSGTVTEHDLTPLTNSVLAGLVSPFTDQPVNAVNAPSIAKERGLCVSQSTTAEHDDFVSTLTVRLKGPQGGVEVSGTVFGRRELRIIKVDQFELDAIPEGNLLLMRNDDVPGVVGRLGTLLGNEGVNIAQIHLSRYKPEGQAFSMLNVDSPVPAEVLEAVQNIAGVIDVTQITLP